MCLWNQKDIEVLYQIHHFIPFCFTHDFVLISISVISAFPLAFKVSVDKVFRTEVTSNELFIALVKWLLDFNSRFWALCQQK